MELLQARYEENMSQNKSGKTYQRPWGCYTTLDIADGYQVKTITVNPGQKLSLQKHFKRCEHWVVVKGSPTITIDDNIKTYNVNEAVYIPLEAKHRLENQSDKIAMIVEVQIGEYLGEDDIVRFEDIYHRKN